MLILNRSVLLRHFGVSLAFCSIIISSSTAHATACRSSNDIHNAFNLAGLKSELMVTALSCKTQDRYNAFINQHRPSLTAAEIKINAFFRKTYGRLGARKRDDYITQLADIQSLGGLKSGTVFCDQRVPMFDEIAALDTADDLTHYAAAKDIVQPTAYESCTAPPSHPKRHTRAKTRHH